MSEIAAEWASGAERSLLTDVPRRICQDRAVLHVCHLGHNPPFADRGGTLLPPRSALVLFVVKTADGSVQFRPPLVPPLPSHLSPQLFQIVDLLIDLVDRQLPDNANSTFSGHSSPGPPILDK
jgi:hypothetical protein